MASRVDHDILGVQYRPMRQEEIVKRLRLLQRRPSRKGAETGKGRATGVGLGWPMRRIDGSLRRYPGLEPVLWYERRSCTPGQSSKIRDIGARHHRHQRAALLGRCGRKRATDQVAALPDPALAPIKRQLFSSAHHHLGDPLQ